MVATRAEFSLLKYRGNFALLFCVKIEPINSKEFEEEGKITINPEYGYEFSHTLESQIRGQLKNGLAMIDFYESCDKRNRLSRYGNDYIATLCMKL